MLRFIFSAIAAVAVFSVSVVCPAQVGVAPKPEQGKIPTQGNDVRADAQFQARINRLIQLINLKPNLIAVNQSNQVLKDPNWRPYNPDGTRNQDFTVRPDYSHPSISRAVNAEQNRETAVNELIKIGKPAVPALVGAVTNEGYEYRQYYARALGGIGDMRAVPAILKYYRDGVMQVNLARMIRESGDAAAAGECENKGRVMKQAAIKALEKMSGQKFGDDFAKWNQWWNENKANVNALPVPKHYSASPVTAP